MPELAIIVAAAENRTIGKGNKMPWRLPGDLQYFKRVTMGSPIIMGRKTFESIGRVLPGRLNVVVTRNPEWKHEGLVAANSLDEAKNIALEHAHKNNNDHVFVVGGAQLYEQALQLSTKLYFTEVHAEIEGDVFFPLLDMSEWQEISRESPQQTDGDSHSYSFVTLEKIIR